MGKSDSKMGRPPKKYSREVLRALRFTLHEDRAISRFLREQTEKEKRVVGFSEYVRELLLEHIKKENKKKAG